MADTPTFLSGLRSTKSGDWEASERPKNFREMILWLDPNGMTPLTAISSKMKTESTDDPEFAWWEEVMDARRALFVSLDAGVEAAGNVNTITVSASSPTVTNPARQFKIGDLLQIKRAAGEPATYSDMEIVRVESIVDLNTFTCRRQVAGTVHALAAGDAFLQIGSAYAEGDTSPNAKPSYPTKLLNYTQIFKSSFNLTGTAKETRFRTGDPWANDRKRAMFEHSQAQELAFMFGIAREDSVSGTVEPLRYMGGLRHFLQSHVNVSVGSVTEDFFFDSIAPLFDYNAGGAGDQRICFVGNGAINSFNKAVRDAFPTRMQYVGAVKFYGMKLQEFQIPQGTFYMKTHPLLNTDPLYTNSMFVLNGKGIIRRPMRNRDTKIQTNIQANDADLRKDQWITEVGLELQFERTQGYFSGITY